MKSIDSAQAGLMLQAAARRIIESKPRLTELDGKIGDGDHGIGMALGMEKAEAALAALPEDATVNERFIAVGKAMLTSMGGASGVIFGTMFRAGAKELPPARELDADMLRRLFRGSLEAVKARGGAARGDKTMVDALEPAVEAMEASGSEELEELLGLAEAAALEGAEATKGMVARFGRAKSLMERSLGHQDAGATSVWLIFGAMHEYVRKLC